MFSGGGQLVLNMSAPAKQRRLIQNYLQESELNLCAQFVDQNGHYMTRIAKSTPFLMKTGQWHNLFTKLTKHTSRDAATRTRYVKSHKNLSNGKLFFDGKFIKEYMLDSAELICSEKMRH